MSQTAKPDLVSVVVGAREAEGTIATCLASILRAGRREIENGDLEVIVAMPAGDPAGPLVGQAFPVVRRVEAPGRPNLAGLRAAGYQAARGRLVAFTDAHCVVGASWVAGIRRAFAAGADAAGGAVRNGGRGLAAWALYLFDYGPYHPPLLPGPARDLTGNSIAYRREVLGEPSLYADGGLWKVFANERLAAEGRRMIAVPEMEVTWARDVSLGRAMRDRFHFGRCFAANRAARRDRWWRAAYRLGSPLLPALVPWRALGRALRSRAPARARLLAAPGVLLIALAWGLGEAAGVWLGRGTSCREVY